MQGVRPTPGAAVVPQLDGPGALLPARTEVGAAPATTHAEAIRSSALDVPAPEGPGGADPFGPVEGWTEVEGLRAVGCARMHLRTADLQEYLDKATVLASAPDDATGATAEEALADFLARSIVAVDGQRLPVLREGEPVQVVVFPRGELAWARGVVRTPPPAEVDQLRAALEALDTRRALALASGASTTRLGVRPDVAAALPAPEKTGDPFGDVVVGPITLQAVDYAAAYAALENIFAVGGNASLKAAAAKLCANAIAARKKAQEFLNVAAAADPASGDAPFDVSLAHGVLRAFAQGEQGTGKTSGLLELGNLAVALGLARSVELVSAAALPQDREDAEQWIRDHADVLVIVDESHQITELTPFLQAYIALTERPDMRSRLPYIWAGYPDGMSAFKGIDIGLFRRSDNFLGEITFDTPSTRELVVQLLEGCARRNIPVADDAADALVAMVQVKRTHPSWGNWAESRNIIEKAVARNQLRWMVAVHAADTPQAEAAAHAILGSLSKEDLCGAWLAEMLAAEAKNPIPLMPDQPDLQRWNGVMQKRWQRLIDPDFTPLRERVIVVVGPDAAERRVVAAELIPAALIAYGQQFELDGNPPEPLAPPRVSLVDDAETLTSPYSNNSRAEVDKALRTAAGRPLVIEKAAGLLRNRYGDESLRALAAGAGRQGSTVVLSLDPQAFAELQGREDGRELLALAGRAGGLVALEQFSLADWGAVLQSHLAAAGLVLTADARAGIAAVVAAAFPDGRVAGQQLRELARSLAAAVAPPEGDDPDAAKLRAMRGALDGLARDPAARGAVREHAAALVELADIAAEGVTLAALLEAVSQRGAGDDEPPSRLQLGGHLVDGAERDAGAHLAPPWPDLDAAPAHGIALPRAKEPA